MTHTTISSFTQAAQQAQQWVNELAADLNWSEPRAYHLFRSVLHALRDWLSPEEAADLSAQLPVLVRGIFFEDWRPQEGPACDRKKEDFVFRITRDLGDHMPDADTAIAAVFRLLDGHVSPGEIRQVRDSMKKSLRQLWPTH